MLHFKILFIYYEKNNRRILYSLYHKNTIFHFKALKFCNLFLHGIYGMVFVHDYKCIELNVFSTLEARRVYSH